MAFTYLAFAYIMALVLSAALIFFAIWHVISFDEIKNDHRNPMDQCKVLNPLVLPEYIVHGVIIILVLFGGDLITTILNMPLLYFHIRKFLKRPVYSGWGVYDPTLIMNGDVLSSNIREGWIKLGFYMITFFYYLYCFVSTLIA